MRTKTLTILLAGLLLLTPEMSLAKEPTLPEGARVIITNLLDKRQVPKEKQEILLQKLARGELWDSMKEEYKDLAPQTVTDTYRRTYYPDGSFKIESKDLNPLAMNDLFSAGLLSPEDMPFLLELRLRDMGVSEEEIPALIATWKEGKPWESLRPGALPVKTLREDHRRVDVFSDGSRRIGPAGGAADSSMLYAARDFGLVTMSMRIKVKREGGNVQFLTVDQVEFTALSGDFSIDGYGHVTGAKPVTHAWYAGTYRPAKGDSVRLFIKLFANDKESWLLDGAENVPAETK